MRFLVSVAFCLFLIYLAATVKLGDKTLVQHIRAIWHTHEAQDFKHGVEDTARPAVNRIEHGAKQGYQALTEDDAGSAGSAQGSAAHGSGSAAHELR